MSVFLLVHGSWHGAWCWSRLIPYLESEGHRAVAIDLPAHGADRTPPWSVTLPDYAERVCESAKNCGEPVIAVGHSMGGLPITQAVSDAPEHFAALVYLCAFVPLDGERLLALAMRDRRTLLWGSVRPHPSGVTIGRGRAARTFYRGCAPEDAEQAAAQLRPEPVRPLLQPLRQRAEPAVPRVYIECTEDETISLERQRAMRERVAFDRVLSLETAHSPFLADPEALADHLLTFAELVR